MPRKDPVKRDLHKKQVNETKAYQQAMKNARSVVSKLAAEFPGTVFHSGGKWKYVDPDSEFHVVLTKKETRKGAMLKPRGYLLRVVNEDGVDTETFDSLDYEEARDAFATHVPDDADDIGFPEECGLKAIRKCLEENGIDPAELPDDFFKR